MRHVLFLGLCLSFLCGAQAAEIKKESGRSARDGDLVVTGVMERATVKAYLDRQGAKFRSCYLRGLGETKKRPRGSISARFGIGPHGKVTIAVVTSSSFHNEKMESCVEDVLRNTVFPPIEGGGVVEADYTLRFPLSKARGQPKVPE